MDKGYYSGAFTGIYPGGGGLFWNVFFVNSDQNPASRFIKTTLLAITGGEGPASGDIQDIQPVFALAPLSEILCTSLSIVITNISDQT